MKKVFYTTPVVETICANGSERFGAKAMTKMWTDTNPKNKINVSVSAKTKEEAKSKLITFLSSSGKTEIEEVTSVVTN